MGEYDLMKLFEFKSSSEFFWRERADVKNNTVRRIDLSDDRFIDLISWMRSGWNDGDIAIKIVEASSNKSFVRDIRDICIWDDLIIITWNENQKSYGKMPPKNVRKTTLKIVSRGKGKLPEYEPIHQ